MHVCLKKTVGHIEGGEEDAISTIRKNLRYAGEREGVGNGVRIELSVIINPTWQDRRIHFWDYESA